MIGFNTQKKAKQPALYRFNVAAAAASGIAVADTTPLQQLERLAAESAGPEADASINWKAIAQLRAGANGQADTWLHLLADTSMQLTCQRCLSTVQTPLQVDQWYRFVDSEEVAMHEDDGCDEDLLVMTPEFDLAALIEDELLMALPLVPMHNTCPVMPMFNAGDVAAPAGKADKPNPFAVLAKLKR